MASLHAYQPKQPAELLEHNPSVMQAQGTETQLMDHAAMGHGGHTGKISRMLRSLSWRCPILVKGRKRVPLTYHTVNTWVRTPSLALSGGSHLSQLDRQWPSLGRATS